MLISKTLKVYELSNMIIFDDATAGFLGAVPKGSAIILPFLPYQAPDIGFRFVDLRSNEVIAQIKSFAQVQDINGNSWGTNYATTLANLCSFFFVNEVDSVDTGIVTIDHNAVIITLLQELLEEQRITNRLLTKIYQ